MRRQNVRRVRGFTLIEVLLVAGILAILAAFAIPKLFDRATEAKEKIAKATVGQNGPIAKALDSYKWDMGKYPETDEGLAVLFQERSRADDERYKGPYLKGVYEELKDPWGHALEYKSPGDVNENDYDLWSRGQDGEDNDGKEGSDDIKNWIAK